MDKDTRIKFHEVLQGWISEGWLKKSSNSDGEGIIPLLAVKQEKKGKVRPVMDYRELNQFISSHTLDAVSVDDELREWRSMPKNCKVIDLKNAYLQIGVDSTLWKYQRVRINSEFYELTRLGFGLVSAPKIMSMILGKVLSIDEKVRRGTRHYVDDIIVNEDIVSVEEVRNHLLKYGLQCKDPEELNGARVLGLQLSQCDGVLNWSRSTPLPLNVPDKITRRGVYSICGKLIGHYPIGNWLRVACSYIKRSCNGLQWNEPVNEESINFIREVMDRISNSDPVRGRWNVDMSRKCTIWCDASSIAIGCVLQIGDHVIEDGSWLRQENDCAHISIAELEAIMKGINLALKWNVKKLLIVTDSVVVHGWLASLKTRKSRIKVTGMSEILVRRRLAMIDSILNESEIDWECDWVRSELNKADVLTRVPRKWTERKCCIVQQERKLNEARKSHERHHFGIEKSCLIAEKEGIEVSKKDMESVVRNCQRCSSIDPAPIKTQKGSLSVDKCWERLAIDHTHYKNRVYLSVIDCGPSRFSIWREVKTEGADDVIKILDELFMEHGAPTEILVDNGGAFTGDKFKHLCIKWSVKIDYRCAHRPSTNGIVERCHRTIKRIAERSNIAIAEAVYWYNIGPKRRKDGIKSPSDILFNYNWRIMGEKINVEPMSDDCRMFEVGEKVYVKPSQHVRCTSQWGRGIITAKISHNKYEVDGVPRHIQDIRKRSDNQNNPENEFIDDLESSEDESEAVDEESSVEEIMDQTNRDEQRRSERERREPPWHRDYEMDT